MKTRLAIWLVVEVLVAAGISTTACILRRDQVRAYRAWHDHPTPETRAELDRQKTITLWHHVAFAGVLFAGMAIVTIPVVLIAARRVAGNPNTVTRSDPVKPAAEHPPQTNENGR